jgi:hypothetical protein
VDKIWVRSEQEGVICDSPDAAYEGKGSAGWITYEATWERFLNEGPRKRQNHLVISIGRTKNKKELIPAAQVGDYKFAEVLKRLEVDFGVPRPKLNTDQVHELHGYRRRH